MRITLIFEPSPDRALPFADGPESYRELADGLSRYTDAPVRIVVGSLKDAPKKDFLLFASNGNLPRALSECGPTAAATVAPRVVLLDVSWQTVLGQLEQHRLAGAVDSLRLTEWMARPTSSAGPYGLRYLAKSIGAAVVPLPSFQSARYCLLKSEQRVGLPRLLADYLAAYELEQSTTRTRVYVAREITVSVDARIRRRANPFDAGSILERSPRCISNAGV